MTPFSEINREVASKWEGKSYCVSCDTCGRPVWVWLPEDDSDVPWRCGSCARSGVAVPAPSGRRRRALGKRLRFRVLARDKFTCRYCGRRAPDVELEVDHVQPVSRGGADSEENLVAACSDCNRGKGAWMAVSGRSEKGLFVELLGVGEWP